MKRERLVAANQLENVLRQIHFRRPARCWSSSFAKLDDRRVSEQIMDKHDSENGSETSQSPARRKFLYAVGGAGIVSAAGLALMGGRRSATKIDDRRSQMES